ncbi:MAG TPA: TonB-dependent receptor [Rhodanobacteraceae bacterium]|nr:TonB-dependent receptor [Rhodanobacteraceae bacterium]
MMQSVNDSYRTRARCTDAHAARPTRRYRLRACALAIAVALSATCVPVLAAEVANAQAIATTFNIPAGTLEAALNAMAQQAGIQLSYDPGLVTGKRVEGLYGSYTPAAALSSLLRDSKITWKAATPTSYVLTADPQSGGTVRNPERTHDHPVQADPPATTDVQQKPATLQAVQVVGIRASLMKSLQTQRFSNSVVSAVTAEDIGKFPNTDVGESMASMPGVTIDRRFGQGGRVSINGTDPNLNLTYLDGNPIASVDWLFGSTPDRGFSYASLPPDIVGQIEVYKTSQARLPSGSIGGVTIIHTRQPLDLKANTLAVSVGTAYNDSYGNAKPNASVVYSWKNAADTFGVSVAASYYAEDIQRAGREIFAYPTVQSMLPDPTAIPPVAGSQALQNAVTAGTVKPTDIMPEEESAAWFRQTRVRKSGLVNVQWKPNSRLEFGAQLMRIRENYDNYNESFYAQQGVSFANITSVAPSVEIPGLSGGATGIVPSGHVCGDDSTPACAPATTFFDNQARDTTVQQSAYTFHGSYSGDNWGLRVEYGQSWATDPSVQFFVNPEYGGGFAFDILHGFTFDNPAAAQDPANWNSRGNPLGAYFQQNYAGRTRHATVDAHFDFDNSFINQILIGARHLGDDHSENALEYAGGGRAGSLADIGSVGFADIATGSPFAGFSPDMQHHIDTTRQAVKAWILDSPGFFDPQYLQAAYQTGNTWSLAQRTNAVYAQANFAQGPWRGNFGLRYVWNTIDAHTFVLTGSPSYPLNPDWWQGQQATFRNLLPAFNLVYDNSGQFVYRFAASENIAWAPYSELAPSLAEHETFLIGTQGNPDLKPYKTINYSASVAWYFAPQSVVELTGFYQNILNYLSTITVDEKEYNANFTANPALYAQYEAAGTCDAVGTCDYSITQPGSIGGGRVRGFTLAYQQPFGNTGFGLVANYTYANGKTTRAIPGSTSHALPFDSKNSITVSPYYEHGPLTARVTWNYRSKYSAGGFVAGAAPATVGGYTEIDAQVGWQFNKHFGLTLSAMNLLDETYKMYQDTEAQPLNKYLNGRRYFATLNYKL